MLSKIGGISSEESTQYLTAALKGYQMSNEEAMSIVDKISTVDMASATSVSGLAEGMSKVASAANLVGKMYAQTYRNIWLFISSNYLNRLNSECFN